VSVVKSNRKVLEQAQGWLQGPSLDTRSRNKAKNNTADKPDLSEQILRDRLAARQARSLERAKQAGDRRKNISLEKARRTGHSAGSHNSTKPSPAPPKARRRSSTGRSTARSTDDESLKLAMELQQQEWRAPAQAAGCTAQEQARRAALLGVVDERLQNTQVDDAYASELQRMQDEQASQDLIAQMQRDDQREAQRMARAQQRQWQIAQQEQQDQMQQAMMASMAGGNQVDMSYENLVQLSPVEVGLSEAALSTLPRRTVADTSEPGTECVICLTPWESESEVVQLADCSHCFHVECITKWLRAHTKCPMCCTKVAGELTFR